MKKLINFIVSKIKYIVLIYVAIQLVLIFTENIAYKSDALYYYTLAEKCVQQNEFYPSTHNLKDDYIVAPLYINVIYLILKVYNSTLTISLLNILITLSQIFVLYHITNKLFSKHTARLTILLYIFYLNTLGLILQNYTELFFLLMISFSIYFFILQKNINLILSGIFAGCAIGVRPVGWALFAAFLIIHLVSIYKHKKISFNYLYVYSGIAVFIILFGIFNKLNSGHFEFTSSTGPINLLLGANDDATGGFNSTVLEKDKAGYIEFTDSMTYLQKDYYYQEKAISWISENPVKWILLAPMKFIHTFGWDDISLSPLLGISETNFAHVMKIILFDFDFDKALPNTSTIFKIFYLSMLIFQHLFYYILLFAILIGIYRYIKNPLNDKTINLILIYSVITILMIMLTVGSPRYKYPIFILLLPFAASYLEFKFGIGNKNIEK
jgi:hypothetical protein